MAVGISTVHGHVYLLESLSENHGCTGTHMVLHVSFKATYGEDRRLHTCLSFSDIMA